MTDRSFERANDESRAELARLVATLTPPRLRVDLGGGWTVASALVHMGFWDRWQASRWTALLAGTWAVPDDTIATIEHVANEALEPYLARTAAPDVPALAVEAAATVDALIASVPDKLVDTIDGGQGDVLLHRHRHRREHIDQIERGLRSANA